MTLIERARFWMWCAMRYPQFDRFQIAILSPVSYLRWYRHQDTQEIIFFIAVRRPRLVIMEPAYLRDLWELDVLQSLDTVVGFRVTTLSCND